MSRVAHCLFLPHNIRAEASRPAAASPQLLARTFECTKHQVVVVWGR